MDVVVALLLEAAVGDGWKRWTWQSLNINKHSSDKCRCTATEGLYCGLGLHSNSSCYSGGEAALGKSPNLEG